MRSYGYVTVAVCCFAVSSGSSDAGTPIGTGFRFQGQLKQRGAPVTENADFEFTLFDAETDGTPIGDTITLSEVAVVNGVFSVELDFGAAAFDGNARWLETTVRVPHDPSDTQPFTPLAPRQPIAGIPYAIQTRGMFVDSNRNVGIGTATPDMPLHVETDGAEGAILGNHTATSLARFGVVGQSASSGGRGVFGHATSGTGLNTGVWGQTLSTAGRGILGIAAPTSGSTFGVFGQTNSTEGCGVYGFALAGSGATRGVHGEVNSPDGYAAFFEGGRSFFEGNVGIGTDQPERLLHVATGDSGRAPQGNAPLVVEDDASAFINVLAPDASETGVLFGNPGSGSAAGGIVYNSGATPDGLQFRTNGNSVKMSITGDGLVGIGTTRPRSATTVTIQGVDNPTNSGWLQFRNAAGADEWHLSGVDGGLWITESGVANRMALTAGGNVGIGTTTPSAKLHVAGDLFVEGGIERPRVSRSRIYLPIHFAADSPFTDIGTLSGRPLLTIKAIAISAFLPIDLPDGATITAVSAFVRDPVDENDLRIELKRQGFGQSAPTSLASAETSGSPGNTLLEFVTNITLDVDNFAYFLDVRAVGESDCDGPPCTAIFEVEIQYLTAAAR